MSIVNEVSASAQRVTDWQTPFAAMLPAIERQARRSLACIPRRDREEALQAIIAYAAVAYARLVQRGKAHLGYPTPLANFGLKQFQAGRNVGGRMNCRDVGSKRCRRASVERLDDWKDVLVETRRSTPAEIASLRIDFGDWLQTLSPRDRRAAKALVRGEQTSGVAKLFRLTAGRVSQLRRELYWSWQEFVGETAGAAG
jgi:hypothetical protein